MAEKKRQRTQKSKPAEGKPIEIPVPKRKNFEKLLGRAINPKKPKRG